MLLKIIDFGLTLANVVSLINNNKTIETKEEKKKIHDTNKIISNFRNTAYIVKRLLK